MPDSHLYDADVIIIGGGIIGTATALELKQQHPKIKVLLLEKESGLARHQTGRNSGVIHAGVYYQPGSLKAQFCKEGAADIKKYCRKHKIPFQECGKLIVATNEKELSRLDELEQRCTDNKITFERLDQTALKIAEPQVSGLAALHIPETAIVDYQQITEQMMETFVEWGGEYWLDCHATDLKETRDSVEIQTNQGRFKSHFVICCAGIMADRLVKMSGIEADFQIIPFRGEYYRLPSKHNQIVKHLIYPVPDPDLPFLGIHLTKMIDGSITVGPNAVLGWKRYGYGKINMSWQDTRDILAFKGFWRLVKRYFKHGVKEWLSSTFKALYLKRVQTYCPDIKEHDLKPYPVGIRAQAVNNKGELIHDFIFENTERTLHVCNAPSPAATSSLPIARYIVKKLNNMAG